MADEIKVENSAGLSNESKKIESSSQDSGKKPILYGDIPAIPTMEGPNGIRYDFNSGLRVFFPNDGNKYHLKFEDAETGIVSYDSDVDPGTVITAVKKYYIKYRFFVTKQGTGEKVFEHTMDMAGKNVVIQFPVGTIGDSIGWFSYVERFEKKHGCNIILVVSDFLRDLVKKQYPKYKFIAREDVLKQGMYASFYIGLFFNGDLNFQPIDFRYSGLHRTCGMIMGLRTREELIDIPPRFDLTAKRKIKEKYVCIATKASAQCKFWNNPNGWNMVIEFLKNNGYRVLCIDKDRVYGTGYVFNQMPWGVEDFTGALPLQERVDLIKDADFFIGLGSGLSWLAWCCRVPIVMISGFSLPNTEFYTPFRVINYQCCTGCWDDIRENVDHNDFFWCPRHKGDDRQFECTRLITPEQVINVIKKIPTFKEKK